MDLLEKMRLDGMWDAARFKNALADLSEMRDLLTTPFMLEIIVQVLPELSTRTASNLALAAPTHHSPNITTFPTFPW